MLKRLATPLIGLALLAAPALAEDTPATAAATAVTDADPALWVVKDDDTTIYLFGTVHVLKPGLTWFDEAVKKAFDSSDELVMEIKQPDPMAMQGMMMKMGMDPAQTPLSEQLGEETGKKYVATMQGLGIPQSVADKFKPWLAATVLSVAPLGKLGYDPGQGPEQVLTKSAGEEGKQVGALETVEQQLGYLDGLSHDAQIEFLKSTIDDADDLGPMMAKMVDYWAAGKPDALAKLLNDEMQESPELKTKLLTNRNRNWADWIDTRLDTPGTVFVAVGAGHLAGDESVQAQLAAHHLKATRIAY